MNYVLDITIYYIYFYQSVYFQYNMSYHAIKLINPLIKTVT